MTRSLPNNPSAEKAVLAAMLIDQQAAVRAATVLDDPDFYDARHRAVFGAMVDLMLQDKPVDAVTVIDKLTETGRLPAAGGASYVASLGSEVPLVSHLQEYIEEVREHSIRRAAIETATRIARAAYDPKVAVGDLVTEGQERMLKLGMKQSWNLSAIGECFKERWRALYDSREDPNRDIVPTGFRDIDDRTGGMAPGELVILAGRPSMGKTSLGFQIAVNLAKRSVPSIFFSLEMSRSQLADRLAALELGIDSNRLRLRLVPPETWQMGFDLARNTDLPLYVDDSGGLSSGDITARARLAARLHGIRLVVVDYLQFISEPQRRGQSRNDLVGQITRNLKALAKSLDVPVLVLSQLNRACELRQDKHPQLADLRESGNIEQDADQVWLLWRPEFYKPDDRPGIACLAVAKHRNGPTFDVELQFEKRLTKFRDLAKEEG